ncbi:cytochrome P450 [Coprinopsis cinerea AmutBmut pab1-1]|nr:cytochrome P450 [Coprinopsis cinerea AmutBmut pab1-1]
MPYSPSGFVSLVKAVAKFEPQVHSALITVLLAAVLVSFALGRAITETRKGGRLSTLLPPGPKGIPFFGNLFQIPQEYAWIVYNDWARKYGDIIYFEALGQPIIVLNSYKDVAALLEKKAPKYSDRPGLPALEM